MKTYRVEKRWPTISTGWSYTQENDGLTRKRAFEIHKENAEWVNMESRVIVSEDKVIAVRRRKKKR